jgi:type IV fimbrial biogenesis protein FimT
MAGFTLIELLIVVTVTALLLTLGVTSFNNLISANRAKAAATDLYVALTKTRSEALKRNANVTLSPNAGGWQSGWNVVDATALVLDTHGAVSGVTITNGPANVVYQSSGRIQGNTSPAFLVTGTGNAAAQRCVSIAPSGRPYTKASAC